MFEPDYRIIEQVMANRRPSRLPVYEHIISDRIMERVLNVEFANLIDGDAAALDEYFRNYCEFFRRMTYDTVSFEAGIAEALPGHGAIYGGMAGPIQGRGDFERYPWDEVPVRFWEMYDRQYQALCKALPLGMKAIGGVGYGVFEISEDLVGYEGLSYMQADDPVLFAELYRRIGELMAGLWREFLARYGDSFAVCRMGDDLGYKTGLLMDPATLRGHVVPQYRRLIAIAHGAEKPFLWHSCGRIFEIMDDVIAAGIDAKHSNEDVIAPFDEWIERYSGRIALFGGVDMDLLCRHSATEVRSIVTERAGRFRRAANGYALGSGNSIPDYVPVEGYLALIEAAIHLRELEN